MSKHIYVHIPFCEAKCPYCSFYSVAGGDSIHKEYFDALIYEIENTALDAIPDGEGPDTVYFGGGTPSVPESRFITDALAAILRKFSVDPNDAEITIEANPHSLTKEKAEAYVAAGFNRISLGIQSLHDDTLKTLGRLHDREKALDALRSAREAGFKNISGDLIIGVPGQSYEDVISDADALIRAGVSHISSYSLSIEEGTVFEKRYGDSLDDPDIQDEERRMYHGLRAFLKENGFEPYEISNSALKGYRSRHNDSYWRAVEYYGLGAGAHGYVAGVRYGHPDDVSGYIRDPLDKIVEEELSEDDKMIEYSMLMLRTSDGITDIGFGNRFGKSIPSDIKNKMEDLVQKGLAERIDGGIRLSSHGLDLANVAFREMLR